MIRPGDVATRGYLQNGKTLGIAVRGYLILVVEPPKKPNPPHSGGGFTTRDWDEVMPVGVEPEGKKVLLEGGMVKTNDQIMLFLNIFFQVCQR